MPDAYCPVRSTHQALVFSQVLKLQLTHLDFISGWAAGRGGLDENAGVCYNAVQSHAAERGESIYQYRRIQ